MSDSDMDFDSSSFRADRIQRTSSYHSVHSAHQDDIVESQNLLESVHNNPQPVQDGDQPAISMNEEVIRRAVQRALEPMMHRVKQLKIQMDGMDKKLSTTVHQNEDLKKQIKELKSEVSKGVDDLPALLTSDGLQALKAMCFRNLDMTAKEEAETELFDRFWSKAKEEGWLMKTSGKAQKDVKQKYREKRNYLKAQIKIRINEDLVNKTPNHASRLEKTTKFVKEHIGVAELAPDCQRILYNLAYTLVKYSNKNADPEAFDTAEKEIQKQADKNLWIYVMERVERDRKAKRDNSVIKDRLVRLLESGVVYEPKI